MPLVRYLTGFVIPNPFSVVLETVPCSGWKLKRKKYFEAVFFLVIPVQKLSKLTL
jgi:hypothetical protein